MAHKNLIAFALMALAGTLAWAAPTKIGADKCKMCHKVQYESWAASKHAKTSPVLDCEACHGPGSDYKSMAVMKDPAAAKKAGLIEPTKADCAKCHGKGGVSAMSDALYAKVHAHKKK
jgi:cytochrome c553